MKLGVSTYPYLWKCSLIDALKGISSMGLHHVELTFSPPHLGFEMLTHSFKSEVKKTLKEEKLFAETLNIPGLDLNIASVYPEARKQTVYFYKRLIELASEWEIPYVLMHSGKLHPLLTPDFEVVWQMCKPDYEAIIRYAEDHHVRVLVENMPSLFIETSLQLRRVIEEFNSHNFMALYDVSNGFMVEDPANGVRNLGPYLQLVHLNDTSKTKWAHNVIGENDIDFTSIVEALDEINYTNNCIMEIIPPENQIEKGVWDSIHHLQKCGWRFEL